MIQRATSACLAALLLILSATQALALQAGVVNRIQGRPRPPGTDSAWPWPRAARCTWATCW